MASQDGTDAWKPDLLPRGRHKLPREEVRASQRGRLLRGIAEVVGEEGYESTTVPKVVARARVSTNTFYEYFPDKAACFIAFCEQASDELFGEISSVTDQPDWLTALDVGLDRYLRWWQERPALTVAYVLELPAAGRRAAEQWAHGVERYTGLIRYLGEQARAEDPDLPPLDDVTVAITIAAPGEIVAREVRAGRLDRLTEVHSDLCFLMIRLIADDATASRARKHTDN